MHKEPFPLFVLSLAPASFIWSSAVLVVENTACSCFLFTIPMPIMIFKDHYHIKMIIFPNSEIIACSIASYIEDVSYFRLLFLLFLGSFLILIKLFCHRGIKTAYFSRCRQTMVSYSGTITLPIPLYFSYWCLTFFFNFFFSPTAT